jgi:hypothetical protein
MRYLALAVDYDGKSPLMDEHRPLTAEKGNTMLKNATPLEDELEKQTIPTGTPGLPKHSQWGNLVLTLKVIGIALAISGAIWGIEYLKNQ